MRVIYTYEARRTAYSQAVAKLQQGATAAATTLLKVMLDQTTPDSVKVRAAECVMNHSSKAIEIEDVEFRVAELEGAGGSEEQGMKAILRRLDRIEQSLAPKPTAQDRRMAELADQTVSDTGSGSRRRVCPFRNHRRYRPITMGVV
jgi:hypothetical protein